MESVNTPKNVCFGFYNFCEDCPYSELDIVEDMCTIVTCKNEDICKRVYWAAKKEVSEAMKEKEEKK